jgi:hypothetical protein
MKIQQTIHLRVPAKELRAARYAPPERSCPLTPILGVNRIWPLCLAVWVTGLTAQ